MAGGGSLRMWETYLPRARVTGIDIYDKSPTTVAGCAPSKAARPTLNSWARRGTIGRPTVAIDDGSHFSEHVIASFRYLFPLLADNGLYVIEDTHASYWESFGGLSSELDRPDTIMGFVKQLLDGLHYEDIRSSTRQVGDFYCNIVSIHCYHSIVFIEKGSNVSAIPAGSTRDEH